MSVEGQPKDFLFGREMQPRPTSLTINPLLLEDGKNAAVFAGKARGLASRVYSRIEKTYKKPLLLTPDLRDTPFGTFVDVQAAECEFFPQLLQDHYDINTNSYPSPIAAYGLQGIRVAQAAGSIRDRGVVRLQQTSINGLVVVRSSLPVSYRILRIKPVNGQSISFEELNRLAFQIGLQFDNQRLLVEETQVYVAGNPDNISDAKAMLEEKKLPVQADIITSGIPLASQMLAFEDAMETVMPHVSLVDPKPGVLFTAEGEPIKTAAQVAEQLIAMYRAPFIFNPAGLREEREGKLETVRRVINSYGKEIAWTTGAAAAIGAAGLLAKQVYDRSRQQ